MNKKKLSELNHIMRIHDLKAIIIDEFTCQAKINTSRVRANLQVDIIHLILKLRQYYYIN